MIVAAIALAIWLGLVATARAEEPERCSTVHYVWHGNTPAVVDYVDDPGASATIVGTYLWFQNTAEPASSTKHLVSVKLTRESPNPYTFCHGDTTTPEPEPELVVVAVSAPYVPQVATPQGDGTWVTATGLVMS